MCCVDLRPKAEANIVGRGPVTGPILNYLINGNFINVTKIL